MARITYLGGIHPLALVSEDADGRVYEDDVYNAIDHDSGQPVTLHAGDSAEVSAAMAARLASEFPDYFEIDDKVAKKSSGKKAQADDPSPPADDAAMREQLLQVPRAELEAAAADLGIDAPQAAADEAALVDAIIAKKNEAS